MPDPAGLLDLPEGFSYRVISKLDDVMDDGHVVGDRADGMGCFAVAPGLVALVRNHELSPGHRSKGPFRGRQVTHSYDRDRDGHPLPGGTSTIIYDLRRQAVVRQYASLAGTIRNCAGGTTPWGSWLTCEEDVSRAGAALTQDHGWVFEVPVGAHGLVDPVPLRAMGRFNHEAAAVDPRTGIVYLTEDRDNGLLYRFLPNVKGKLAKGGRLQALAAPGLNDMRNWTEAAFAARRAVPVRWIDLNGVDSPDDDLRQRGHAAGATLFARGEGIHFGAGEFFFTCTSGGAAKLGQVFRYRPSRFEGQAVEVNNPGMLENFLESADPNAFNFGDNLTVAPYGHLVVCEDQYTDVVDNHLRGVAPDGRPYALGRCRLQTELAGACFSPDGSTLFVNLYSPARTLAISGPWPNAQPAAA
ncbi:MAG: alkaline phosphatase PhoX [Pseudomonadota bacterium]|uniref:alkaline phosphatase PhoX n=1 Tax=Sphingobium sp. TaxID=1912891 RepID=UPI002E1D6A30